MPEPPHHHPVDRRTLLGLAAGLVAASPLSAHPSGAPIADSLLARHRSHIRTLLHGLSSCPSPAALPRHFPALTDAFRNAATDWLRESDTGNPNDLATFLANLLDGLVHADASPELAHRPFVLGPCISQPAGAHPSRFYVIAFLVPAPFHSSLFRVIAVGSSDGVPARLLCWAGEELRNQVVSVAAIPSEDPSLYLLAYGPSWTWSGRLPASSALVYQVNPRAISQIHQFPLLAGLNVTSHRSHLSLTYADKERYYRHPQHPKPHILESFTIKQGKLVLLSKTRC